MTRGQRTGLNRSADSGGNAATTIGHHVTVSGHHASITLDAWRRITSVDDGVLADGVVADTSEVVWARVLAAIDVRDWATPPDPDEENLVVRVRPGNGVLIIVRRFDWSSIDFDFDLRELLTQAALDSLCEFVRLVGRTAERDVVLHPEGASEAVTPYAIYRHEIDHFDVSPSESLQVGTAGRVNLSGRWPARRADRAGRPRLWEG